MEKNYKENSSGNDTVKLALKALTDVVDGSTLNIEVAVIEAGCIPHMYHMWSTVFDR